MTYNYTIGAAGPAPTILERREKEKPNDSTL